MFKTKKKINEYKWLPARNWKRHSTTKVVENWAEEAIVENGEWMQESVEVKKWNNSLFPLLDGFWEKC